MTAKIALVNMPFFPISRLVWREDQSLLSRAVPLGFAFKPANRHLERLSAVIASLSI